MSVTRDDPRRSPRCRWSVGGDVSFGGGGGSGDDAEGGGGRVSFEDEGGGDTVAPLHPHEDDFEAWGHPPFSDDDFEGGEGGGDVSFGGCVKRRQERG